MNKNTVYRFFFYTLGLLILSMGLTLNTKAGLGVSPIISVPYSISNIFYFNFGNATLVYYCFFVILQLLLHSFYIKKSGNKNDNKLILLMDVLQIPLSIIFTRFLNIFAFLLPAFSSDANEQLPIRLLVLFFAIVFTGVGAAMSLSMRLVPNPGDGIVQAIADAIHKSVGFTKNCFDLLNISITICLSLLIANQIVGIGIGTLIAMIGVGRIMALYHHFTQKKISKLTNLAY